MPIEFDITGAKKAGYNYKEISSYLKDTYNVDFDVEGAKKAGYSDNAIMEYINKTYSDEPRVPRVPKEQTIQNPKEQQVVEAIKGSDAPQNRTPITISDEEIRSIKPHPRISSEEQQVVEAIKGSEASQKRSEQSEGVKRILYNNNRYWRVQDKKEAQERGYNSVEDMYKDRESFMVNNYLSENDKQEVQNMLGYINAKKKGDEKSMEAYYRQYLDSRKVNREEYKSKRAELEDLKREIERQISDGLDAELGRKSIEGITKRINDLDLSQKAVINPKEEMNDFIKSNITEVASVSKPSQTPYQKLKEYTNLLYSEVLKRKEELGLDKDMGDIEKYFKDIKLRREAGAGDELEELYSKESKLRTAVKLLYLNRGSQTDENTGNVFVKAFGHSLSPSTKGEFSTNQEAANNLLSIIQESDIAKAVYEEQQKYAEEGAADYKPFSSKWFAQNTAPSAAIMLEYIPAAFLTNGAMGVLGLASKLEKAKEAGVLINGLKGYSNALNKYKALKTANTIGKEAVKIGAHGVDFAATSEVVSRLFPKEEDEVNAVTGIFGGSSGAATTRGIEAIGLVLQKVFGNKAGVAARVLSDLGSKMKIKDGAAKITIGEIMEEFGETYGQIYRDSDNWSEIKSKLNEQFGTLEQKTEFVILTGIMGIGMGKGTAIGKYLYDKSIKEYTSLPRSERAKVDSVLDSVKEAEIELNKEAVKEAPTVDEGNGAEKVDEVNDIKSEDIIEKEDSRSIEEKPTEQSAPITELPTEGEQADIDADTKLTPEEKEKAKVESTAKALEGEITFEGKRGQADSITYNGGTIKKGEEIELDNVNISQDDSMPDFRSGKYKVRMLSVDANGKKATLTLTDGNEVITTTVKDLRKAQAEAYHKAKADDSNPELVKAVEDLLSGTSQESKTQQPKTQDVTSKTPAKKEEESQVTPLQTEEESKAITEQQQPITEDWSKDVESLTTKAKELSLLNEKEQNRILDLASNEATLSKQESQELSILRGKRDKSMQNLEREFRNISERNGGETNPESFNRQDRQQWRLLQRELQMVNEAGADVQQTKYGKIALQEWDNYISTDAGKNWLKNTNFKEKGLSGDVSRRSNETRIGEEKKSVASGIQGGNIGDKRNSKNGGDSAINTKKEIVEGDEFVGSPYESIESTAKALEETIPKKDLFAIAVSLLPKAGVINYKDINKTGLPLSDYLNNPKLALERDRAKDIYEDIKSGKSVKYPRILLDENNKLLDGTNRTIARLANGETDFEFSIAPKGFLGKPYTESISEAYHKAKSDGSNPELVKAVEGLLGKKEEVKTEKKVEKPAEQKQEQQTEQKQETKPDQKPTIEQQVKTFGVADKLVKPVTEVANALFSGLKKVGLTAAKNVGEWVGIGKGTEKPYSLKIDGKDTQVKNVQPEVVNGFYSPLEKIITESKFDKLPAKQWAEKYANSEEAKWTGLKDWLNQQQGSVSKADIQQYLKDNRIQVVEVVKDGGISEEEIDTLLNDEVGQDMTRDEARAFLENDERQDDTKFSQYQLEGEKENYKEVLVTMPSNSKYQNELNRLSKKYNTEPNYKSLRESKATDIELEILRKLNTKSFKSSHFDEPNILVHLRMNTRTDADGKKVLFLEEVQSDWGQKGKKEGFKDDVKQKEWDKLEAERQKLWEEVNEMHKGQIVPPLLQQKINEVVKKQQALYEGLQIPQAPFVTDTNAWTKLGLKVALKEAVKQGADKIAWSTGTQQFDRWGSEEIHWNTVMKPKGFEIVVKDDAKRPIVRGSRIKSLSSNDGSQNQQAEVKRLAEKWNLKPEDLEVIPSKGQWTLAINEQTDAQAFQGNEEALRSNKLEESDISVGTKAELRDAIKRNLSRERNDAEIDKLTDRIWNRMQTEDSGTSLPRKEGMEEFYGNPKDMERAKDFTVKKEGDVFAVKDEKGKTIRTFKQENEANKFKENYGLGIVGNVAKSLFKQEPKTTELTEGKWKEEDGRQVFEGADGTYIGDYSKQRDGSFRAVDMFGREKKFDNVNDAKDYIYNSTNFHSTRQHSIDITPELKASVEGGQPLFKDAEAQYRIESGKNIIEAIRDFDGSPRATVALTHEIMHPTVVEIFNGAKEGNETGARHANTIVEEYNKANPDKKITLEQMIEGNDAFINGRTTPEYRAVQEFIAEAFEAYLHNGNQGFSKAFQEVLDLIRDAFKAVYNTLTGKEISPELKTMFDEILGGEAEKEKLGKQERKKIAHEKVDNIANLLKGALSVEDKNVKKAGFINQDKIIDLIAQAVKGLISAGIEIDEAISRVRSILEQQYDTSSIKDAQIKEGIENIELEEELKGYGIEDEAAAIGLINKHLKETDKDYTINSTDLKRAISNKRSGKEIEDGKIVTKKDRAFVKKLINKHPRLAESITEKGIKYTVLPDGVTLEEAQSIIDYLGEEMAIREFRNFNNGMPEAVRMAIGQVLIKDLEAIGETNTLLSFIEDFGSRTTDLAQGLRMLGLFKKLGSSTFISMAEKVVEKNREKRSKYDEARLNRLADAIRELQKDSIKKVLELAGVSDKINKIEKIEGGSISVGGARNEKSSYGENNKVVTKKRAEEARKALRGKKLFSGIPPEVIELGIYHIEAGSRAIGEFADAMTKEFGKKVRPYIRTIYEKSIIKLKDNGYKDSDFSSEADIDEYIIKEKASDIKKRINIAVSSGNKLAIKRAIEGIKTLEGSPIQGELLDELREEYKRDKEVIGLLNGGLFLGSDSSVRQAIRRELKDMKESIRDIVMAHYTVQDYVKQSLVEKLVDRAGLDINEATDLVRTIESEFDAMVSSKRSKIISKLTTKREKKKYKVKGIEDKIIEASNLGVLDTKELSDKWADIMGYPNLTEEHRSMIKALSDEVQYSKEGRQKDRALQRLLGYVATIKGIDKVDIGMGIWYANLLSGYTTQFVNFISTFANSMFGLMNLSLQMITHPKRGAFMAKGFYNGMINIGLKDAKEVLLTGYTPIRGGKIEGKDALELKEFKGLLSPLNAFKYVKRFMIATDTLLYAGNKEMRSYLHAIKEASSDESGLEPTQSVLDKAAELLYKDADSYIDAVNQADLEYEQRLDDINESNLPEKEKIREVRQAKRDRNIRVYEIMEQNRDEKVIGDSADYAARATYNYPPEGVLGLFARIANYGKDQLNKFAEEHDSKAGKAAGQSAKILATWVIPFTNIIANVANESLNYFPPVGYGRAARGNTSIFGLFSKKMDAQQRADAYYKAHIGMVAMSSLALYFLLNDDDDDNYIDITANGKGNYIDNYSLRDKGQIPYSIRIGDRYVSYQYTPLFIPLSIIGWMRDKQKYSSEKKVDEGTAIQLVRATQSIVKTLFDMTFVQGLNTFTNQLVNEDMMNEDKLKSMIGRSASTIVKPALVTQSARDLQAILEIPSKDVRGEIAGQLLQDIPVARDMYYNRVNVLGEPVIPNTDKFISKRKPHKIFDALEKLNITIEEPNRRRLIIEDNGVFRYATKEEFYKYSVSRGRSIKERLTELIEDKDRPLMSMDKKDARELVKRVITRITQVESAKIKQK